MSDRMPIVISHYTRNTGYEKEVCNLRESLRALHLDFYIQEIENLGSWRANSNYTARLVQECLERFRDRSILRVDADAVMHQRPVLFEQETYLADIAAHIHSFRWCSNELLGGTLFFRNTDSVRELVKHWVDMCCVQPSTREKRNPDLLQELLQQPCYSNIRFESLPATYCKIFDLMREVENPVIEHFQASRRFKTQVNAQGKQTISQRRDGK